MGNIIGSKPADEYNSNGETNQIISVAPAQAYAVAYWDAEGKRSTCMVYHFGKLEDGGEGVFVFADQQQMQDTMRVLREPLLRQVRAEIAGKGKVQPSDVASKSTDRSIAKSIALGTK